jgi:hypothetical protein
MREPRRTAAADRRFDRDVSFGQSPDRTRQAFGIRVVVLRRETASWSL